MAWVLFAAVMWFTHFSPLFDAALDDLTLHRLEHALFLGTALLFWWPVVGADPSPHRMGYPARLFYLALGMPLSSFLGLVIFSAETVLYPHYLTLRARLGSHAAGGPAAGPAASCGPAATWPSWWRCC